MPTTHGAGSPNQQLYSLFPKKKKGSKKNEQLEDGVSLSEKGLLYKFDVKLSGEEILL